MIINYTNKKSGTYALATIEEDTYIVATRKSSYDEIIPIYKNGNNSRTITFSSNLLPPSKKLYEVLEKISLPEEKIAFCNTYGTLINHKSPIPYKLNFRINTALSAEVDYLIDTRNEGNLNSNYYFENDCMREEHFTYYIKTLQLITKLSPHTINIKNYEDCFPFVDFIISFIPLVHVMLFSEYDCYDDGFQTFLQNYPFYSFVLTSYDIDTFFDDNVILTTSEYPLCKLINFRKENLTALQASKIVPLAKVKEILHDVYIDIINFHMKNIPFSIITPFMKTHSYSFYTLGDAIIFQRILDETFTERPLVCANELCKKLFWPNPDHYQIYCEPRCGAKVAKRNYKQNKKKKIQESSKVSK